MIEIILWRYYSSSSFSYLFSAFLLKYGRPSVLSIYSSCLILAWKVYINTPKQLVIVFYTTTSLFFLKWCSFFCKFDFNTIIQPTKYAKRSGVVQSFVVINRYLKIMKFTVNYNNLSNNHQNYFKLSQHLQRPLPYFDWINFVLCF